MELKAAEIDAHVGRRMRERREMLKMSQGQLALQLELTFSQIQKYEKGQNRIGAGNLYIIGKILAVPSEYFYEGLPETSSAEDARGSLRQENFEIKALTDAFISIQSQDTRQSVLELVRSLGCKTDPAQRTRRGDSERGLTDIEAPQVFRPTQHGVHK